MWKRGIRVTQYHDVATPKKKSDTIVVERQIVLETSRNETVVFHTIPQFEKELIIGYLAAHQLIRGIGDVEITETGPGRFFAKLADFDTVEETEMIKHKRLVAADNVYRLTAFFQEKSLLYKDTAISHSAALATDSSILVFAEDVGRLSAVYKVIGQAILQKVAISGRMLMVSGKVCKTLAAISRHLGVSTIVSRMAPTDMALDVTLAAGIDLIGFARGRRFVRY